MRRIFLPEVCATVARGFTIFHSINKDFFFNEFLGCVWVLDDYAEMFHDSLVSYVLLWTYRVKSIPKFDKMVTNSQPDCPAQSNPTWSVRIDLIDFESNHWLHCHRDFSLKVCRISMIPCIQSNHDGHGDKASQIKGVLCPFWGGKTSCETITRWGGSIWRILYTI